MIAGYERLAQATDAPPRRISEALERVIDLYERSNNPQQAEVWRKKWAAAN
jgi:hypothetical protein